jgi:hypothetical protein
MTLLRDGFAVMRRAREGMLSELEGGFLLPYGGALTAAPLSSAGTPRAKRPPLLI